MQRFCSGSDQPAARAEFSILWKRFYSSGFRRRRRPAQGHSPCLVGGNPASSPGMEEMNMGGKMTVFSIWILVLILGIPGTGIGDGGGFWSECCQNPPEPSLGSPAVTGTFSAVRNSDHYDVEVILNWEGHKRYLTLNSPLESTPLCRYTDETLRKKFMSAACGLKVGEAFGLVGTPVVRDISVTEKVRCGTPNEMIRGTIEIRVVPTP
jgi:hypothetical protein